MFERRKSDDNDGSKTDAELVRALAGGDEDSMTAIYDQYGPFVYRFSLRMLRDHPIAEEVTQEVFLALLRQSGNFDSSKGRLSTWLCGIARNLVWRHLERLQKGQHAIGAAMGNAQLVSVDTPDSEYDRNEATAAIHTGVDSLPPDLKEVIVLCEFEELTYEDAAAMLRIPIGTIRSRLSRAKQKLAEHLQHHAPRKGFHDSK